MSILYSKWVFIYSLFIVGTALFGQHAHLQKIESERVRFQEVHQEFMVEGTPYRLRELRFASSNILVADSRVNARGEIALASLSSLYTYDGHEVRRLPLPPRLTSEKTVTLDVMPKGWLVLAADQMDGGEYVREVTFFHTSEIEQQRPCAYGAAPSICEIPFQNSGKIGDGSMVLSSRQRGLTIVQKDTTLFVPDSKGFQLLGSFDEWAVAQDHQSGQLKMIAYDENGLRVGSLPALPRSTAVSWARQSGGVLFVGNASWSSYYSLSLDMETPSSSDWQFTKLPDDTKILDLHSRDGLLARSDNGRYYLARDSGLTYSPFYTTVLELLGDHRLVATIDAGQSASGTSIFATKKGLALVTKKKEEMSSVFPLKNLPGISTRQMFASAADHSLWVTSYSELIKLDLSSLPDSLIQMDIPDAQRSCFGNVHQNFVSNEKGILAVNGRNIYYFDRAIDRCTRFTNPSPDKRNIFGLTETSGGSFLIGTTTGLLLLDPTFLDEGLVEVPMPLLVDAEETLDPAVYVHRLKRIGNSDTIFICSSEGLFITFFEDGASPTLTLFEQVTEKSVHDAHILKDGSLLLATEREGLFWLSASPERSLIQQFHSDNYLLSDYTHNIQEDRQERVWVSSNTGLYVIDLKKTQLTTFGKQEGFPSDEFNRISSAVLSDSLMVFGGVNGLSFFNPNDFIFPMEKARVSLRALKVTQDSQLMVFSPHRFIDSMPFFELPAEARFFQAVIDADVFPQTENVYYRTDADSGLWRPAAYGQIPFPTGIERQKIEIKWSFDSERYLFSECIVSKEQKHTLYYIQMALALLVVLAAIGIFIGRYRRQKAASLEEEGKEAEAEDAPGEKAAASPDSSSALPPTLSKREQLLLELKKKETQEYLFPKEGGSNLLRETLSYAEAEMSSSDFSVDAVAEFCNLSGRQFHRRIAEETNLTPNQLFTLVRLRRAKELVLSNSKITVTELANQTGYNNASYFSKKFKDFYGYSPKELSQLLVEMGKA